MSFKKTVKKTLLVAAVAALAGNASATLLSGNLNVDNLHTTYISTDNSVAGSAIISGAHWPTTQSFDNISLDAGQDYYLHVLAQDAGWIAGFLGDFTLTGTDHIFANGGSYITTNDEDWLVSTSGWQDYLTATNHQGTNGVGPWGHRAGVDSNAEWIWSSNAFDHNTAYFSLEIQAVDSSVSVSEPSALALLGLGIAGLAFTRRKTKA